MTGQKPVDLTSEPVRRGGMAAPSTVAPACANATQSDPVPSRRARSGHGKRDTARPAADRGVGAAPAGRPAPPSPGERVRVSLRLDVDRHLRMKLVAMHMDRSLQSLFAQAIDEFFERHTPDVAEAFALLRSGRRADAGGTRPKAAPSTESMDGPRR